MNVADNVTSGATAPPELEPPQPHINTGVSNESSKPVRHSRGLPNDHDHLNAQRRD